MTTSDGVDLTKAVLPAEIWDPATETWTTVASLTTGREYHSTALLLPDGRVLMAGGGQLPGPRDEHLQRRDLLAAVPLQGRTADDHERAVDSCNYGSSFTVSTPDAAIIQKVALIRTPSVTHAFDENQRYIPLSFTRGTGQLTVQAPSNGNIAPPGYYMLFILNGNGVPVGRVVRALPAPCEDTGSRRRPRRTSTATRRRPAAVALTWSASTDNVGVTRVRRLPLDDAPASRRRSANRIGQTTSTTYTDTGLAAGTYYYVVKAEDAAGNLSARLEPGERDGHEQRHDAARPSR